MRKSKIVKNFVAEKNGKSIEITIRLPINLDSNMLEKYQME